MIKERGISMFVLYAIDDNDLYAYQVIIDHKKNKHTWHKYKTDVETYPYVQ